MTIDKDAYIVGELILSPATQVNNVLHFSVKAVEAIFLSGRKFAFDGGLCACQAFSSLSKTFVSQLPYCRLS